MINAQKKGKDYEREWANQINSYFKKICGAKFERTRMPESWQRATSGDIVCSKKWICSKVTDCRLIKEHFECKHRTNMSLKSAWKKAIDDAGDNNPVLVFKFTNDVSGIILTQEEYLQLKYMEFLKNY